MKKPSFLNILWLVATMVVAAQLSACQTPTMPGPYSGLGTTDASAATKIGCFKYTEQLPTGATLTEEEARICTLQAIKCQRQQILQTSQLGETMLSNGAVSAGTEAFAFKQEASALGVAKSVAKRYPGAGAVVGAIGSINPSLLMYSQAQDTPIGGCSRDFMTRYKRLHPGFDDLFIEVEFVRSHIQGNVMKK
jgi:hypothetical protein